MRLSCSRYIPEDDEMKSLAWMLIVPLAAAFLFACSGSENSVCGTDDDCENNQICDDGACKVISQTRCTGNPDCPGGQRCVNEICQPLPQVDMASNNQDNQNNQNNLDNLNNENNTQQDMGSDMGDVDTTNPEVVSVDPPDGATDVDPETTITVTFNEALDPFTVNFQSLALKSPAGDVDISVDYDEDTLTATITPDNPLLEATGYRVVPTAFLRDLAGNSLRADPNPQTRFYTNVVEPEHHTDIATRLAPVIYQSIEDTSPGAVNRDIPTRIDFDGNWRARDNKMNAMLGATRTEAHVYYSVVESHTHYFITYALYYPIRRNKSSQENFEHDFTGIVQVVEKDTEEIVLVEGVKVNASNDTIIAYKPSSSDVSGTGEPQFLETFNVDNLDEEGRYPLFITSGTHEACNWYEDGPTLPAVCRHASERFSGNGDGVVMRPGSPQRFMDAVDDDEDGVPEMTYGLVPMSESLWARRSSVSSEGLWELLSVYTPIDQRPATYPDRDEPVLWMNRLVSDDVSSFGKPPMAWLKLTTSSNEGQWLYDPAYLLTVRYNFGADYTTDYCHNLYLGIDDLDDPELDACQTVTVE